MSMEARSFRAIFLAGLLSVSMGASYRTPNFVVETANSNQAKQYALAAEKYRRDLAVSWLGEPFPNWSKPCTITVQVGANLGAGGATTFFFSKGEVYGWKMSIQGSHERVLDSVLPHEVTHMILASHFRRPLPRWADEGAATSVEFAGERERHRKMLVRFLHSGRGIAFNKMFAMREYPDDVMPLYAQGFSLAEYLIMRGGRRTFLDFLAEGLQNEQWSDAARLVYGIDNLGALQIAWLDWVRQGFPPIQPDRHLPNSNKGTTMLANATKRPRPKPNLIYHIPKGTDVLNLRAANSVDMPSASSASRKAANVLVLGPNRQQMARQQPIEQSRQIVLEWSRPTASQLVPIPPRPRQASMTNASFNSRVR